MRSTVRIDDDLLLELKEQARKENISMTRLFNRALRAGIQAARNPSPRKLQYREKTYPMGMPRFALDKALTLAAEMEDKEIIRKMMLRK